MARNAAFDLGVGIHEALAEFYKRGKDPVAVFEKWVDSEIRKVAVLMEAGGDLSRLALEHDMESLGENRKLGRDMLEGYLMRYGKDRLEVLAVEKQVLKPIPGTDWTFDARLDGLVRDGRRRNHILVLEHKSYSQLQPAYLERDPQFVAYKWCAQDLTDEPVAGVLWNGLRKQLATSKSRLDRYERHVLDINDRQVELLMKRLRAVIEELTVGKFKLYPEPGTMTCSYCAFKDPCMLFCKGGDWRFALENAYEIKPDRTEP